MKTTNISWLLHVNVVRYARCMQVCRYACLDVSKAPGIDEIPSRFLKDGAEILAKPISDIINLSIKLSTFPDKCKIAKLIPLFKKESKTDP